MSLHDKPKARNIVAVGKVAILSDKLDSVQQAQEDANFLRNITNSNRNFLFASKPIVEKH
jgi:hypothetical protein